MAPTQKPSQSPAHAPEPADASPSPAPPPVPSTGPVFTPKERAYLADQPLARLATTGPNGGPQVRPVGFVLNDDDTLDIGGPARPQRRLIRTPTADRPPQTANHPRLTAHGSRLTRPGLPGPPMSAVSCAAVGPAARSPAS
ncbi:pyridoxamine 5'-phosphate oxidase family protein [Streptomyces sp. DB-54]